MLFFPPEPPSKTASRSVSVACGCPQSARLSKSNGKKKRRKRKGKEKKKKIEREEEKGRGESFGGAIPESSLPALFPETVAGGDGLDMTIPNDSIDRRYGSGRDFPTVNYH